MFSTSNAVEHRSSLGGRCTCETLQEPFLALARSVIPRKAGLLPYGPSQMKSIRCFILRLLHLRARRIRRLQTICLQNASWFSCHSAAQSTWARHDQVQLLPAARRNFCGCGHVPLLVRFTPRKRANSTADTPLSCVSAGVSGSSC